METAPNLTVATYFASKQYIAENGTSSSASSARWRSRSSTRPHNEAEVRAVVGEYTQIPAEVTDKIHLPTWRADLNEPTIQTAVDLSLKYGFIEEQPSLDELILRD